jgi:hypothetical protein
MSSLGVRIVDRRPFTLDIDHRSRGRRVLRGLIVLFGLLVSSGS